MFSLAGFVVVVVATRRRHSAGPVGGNRSATSSRRTGKQNGKPNKILRDKNGNSPSRLFSLAWLGKKEKEKGTHQKKMMGYVEVMMGVLRGLTCLEVIMSARIKSLSNGTIVTGSKPRNLFPPPSCCFAICCHPSVTHPTQQPKRKKKKKVTNEDESLGKQNRNRVCVFNIPSCLGRRRAGSFPIGFRTRRPSNNPALQIKPSENVWRGQW